MENNTKISSTVALALGLVMAGWSGAGAVDEVGWADIKQAFVTQGSDGVAYVAFSQEALRRAGKKPLKGVALATTDISSTESATVDSAVVIESTAVDATVDLSAAETRTVSRWFKSKGRGEINIFDPNNISEAGADDLNVLFQVPNGSLSEGVQITMTVYGNYLSDLVIAFQPGGLVFVKDALLLIQVGSGLVDVDTSALTVWHEYGDGTVEEAGLELYENTGTGVVEVQAAVSSFSRYGIRR